MKIQRGELTNSGWFQNTEVPESEKVLRIFH